jgi:hypothetical protein
MKVLISVSLLAMLTSCANSIKTFCKFNAQHPESGMFYEDLDFITMKGLRKSDCATAKANNEYFFYMRFGSDENSVTSVKLSYDRRIHYFKRIRNSANTMYSTDMLNQYEPSGRNYDTLVLISPSEMMIHRVLKITAANHQVPEHHAYYIWKRKSDTVIDFYKFNVPSGQQLDTTVNSTNIQLDHQVAFIFKGDLLTTTRTNYDGPGKRVTEDTEKFTSYFKQVFLKSF